MGRIFTNEAVTPKKLNQIGAGPSISAQAVPDMTVVVGAGVVLISGVFYKIDEQDSPTMSAPATNPRIDLVYINLLGTVSIATGTESATPEAPEYQGIPLGEIYHRTGATSIKNTDDTTNSYYLRDARPLDDGGGSAKALLGTYGTIDGTTTPVPVSVVDSGQIVPTDANASGSEGFVGFVTEEIDGEANTAQYLASGDPGGSDTNVNAYDLTAPAGNNRLLLVYFCYYTPSASLPTSVTWGGVALTKVIDTFTSGGDTGGQVWALEIGDAVSDETQSLAFNGGTATNNVRWITDMVLEDVDQANPYGTGEGQGSSGAGPVTHDDGQGLYAVGSGDDSDSWSASGGTLTERNNHGGSRNRIGTVPGASGGVSVTSSGGFTQQTWILPINSANDPVTGSVQHTGVVGGFSSLTPGEYYYAQDTEGTIGTTPGTTTIKVGIAVSETEILVIQE